MLTSFESVKGIGLLHDARGVSCRLSPSALIYGGNGRGKSSLSTVLRSASTNDPQPLLERATIDGSNEPSVVLQFASGPKKTFTRGAWDLPHEDFVVYDSHFVETNVHSGTEVTADQRRNLLGFALGDSAVAARSAEEAATSEQQLATQEKRVLEAQLAAHAGEMPLAVYRALEPDPMLAQTRERLQERISAADRAETILAQPMPRRISVSTSQIGEVFAVLGRTLAHVHQDAAQAVEAHVQRHADETLTDWLRQGQLFSDGQSCPFCGQDVSAVQLVEMYATYFDEAYSQLEREISQTAETIELLTRREQVEALSLSMDAAIEHADLWRSYVAAPRITKSDLGLAETTIDNLRILLSSLSARKSIRVNEAVGSLEERTEAERLWSQFTQIVSDVNALVDENIRLIDEFKDSLRAEDKTRLGRDARLLDLRESRFSPQVQGLIAELLAQEKRLKDAERHKKDARQLLSTLMSSTLTSYRTAVNDHLTKLGALFSIDEIRTNFLGASPRTDYEINLRGKPVKLSGGTPSFATALSEGDKRTMAFAFFIASTMSMSNLSQKTIVIDDPMSSLDNTRRNYTVEILVALKQKCKQLIILAHDAIFLRDLQIALRRRNPQEPISAMKIERTAGNYSDFQSLDLDRECESTYYKNYRTTSAFVAGETAGHHEVAVALRPLLESYLHRRFPGSIKASVMLGPAIEIIENSEADSPLQNALGIVDELKSLNAFAGKFHHDTNPDFASVSTDGVEVATYASRVLLVVHGG